MKVVQRQLARLPGHRRLDWHSHRGFDCREPLLVRRGGRATAWPWVELHLPHLGSLIISRTRPRRRVTLR